MSITPPITVPTTWADGQVLFAAALNGNFQALLNWINVNGLTSIAAHLDLFVAPGGSDNNTGLTSSSPFGTITHAYAVLSNASQFVSSAASATINLLPGTYNESVILNGSVPGQGSTSQVIIQGNTGSPSTVVINGGPCFQANHGALVTIQGVRMTGSLHGIFCRNQAVVHFQACDFGPVSLSHVFSFSGGYIGAIGDYSISGGGQAHSHTNGPGSQVALSVASVMVLNPSPPAGPNVTITGTPAFSVAFATARYNSGMDFTGFTSSGSATGSRYVADGSYIFTNTSGSLVLPGSSGGTNPNGGIYN
jgi:hypothetical protein